MIKSLSTLCHVTCLRGVHIRIPTSVIPGQTVTMICSYDLEGDPLYTVKWYKGRSEFFRYVPKELPHTRVFPYPGINVDVSQSNSNQVVLRDVQMDIAGKYRCEVSADAPSFHTDMVSSYMHVVQSYSEMLLHVRRAYGFTSSILGLPVLNFAYVFLLGGLKVGRYFWAFNFKQRVPMIK
ncbi:hypothetical protein M8J77_020508 [Diaphorina citri]|nr:hypothetical protein M8J77_020508 [Diaphorina citri]